MIAFFALVGMILCQPQAVHFKKFIIRPDVAIAEMNDLKRSISDTPIETYLMQFTSVPPVHDGDDELEIGSRIDFTSHSYFVAASRRALTSLVADGAVHFAIPWTRTLARNLPLSTSFSESDALVIFVSTSRLLGGFDTAVDHVARFATMINEQHDALFGSTGVIVAQVNSTASLVQIARARFVLWIETAPVVRPHVREVSSAIQSGSSMSSLRTPFFDVGIRGRGEILNVMDSGLERRNCLFSTSPNFQFNVANSGEPKILLYDSRYGDAEDEGGHGTMMATIAVGAVTETTSDETTREASKYEGVAPDARLTFGDVAPPGYGQRFRVFYSVGLHYDVPYSLGARVFSNSWGDSNNNYTVLDSSVDGWLAAHPDAVALYSSGNDGRASADGTVSWGVKNAIVVGASVNSERSLALLRGSQRLTALAVVDNQATESVRASFSVGQSDRGRIVFDDAEFNATLLYESNDDDARFGCIGHRREGVPVSGSILMIDRGNCSFVEKVQLAMQRGAAGVLLANNDTDTFRPSLASVDTIPIFLWSLTLAQADQLRAALASASASSRIRINVRFQLGSSSGGGLNVLAGFSSRGPTQDLRVSLSDCVAMSSSFVEQLSKIIHALVLDQAGHRGRRCVRARDRRSTGAMRPSCVHVRPGNIAGDTSRRHR